MSEQAPRVVTIQKRLRPLRLGFLVRPNDKGALRRVIQVNTSLWGGRYNPIIPVYRAKPKWARQDRELSARTIITGYVDAFEPDFLIETNDKIAESIDFPRNRVLSLSEVFDPAGHDPFGYAVDVFNVFRELYEKEYQFVRRHAPASALSTCSIPTMECFVAACFGEYPSDPKTDYLKESYEMVFGADAAEVTADSFYEIWNGPIVPLRAGSSGIQRRSVGFSPDAALFFLDATTVPGITEFWNLRALGWRVLPIPKQWAVNLREACIDFVAKNYKPFPRNPKIMRKTAFVCSHSAIAAEMEEFGRSLKVATKESLYFKSFPRIWDHNLRGADHASGCAIWVDDSRAEVAVNHSQLSFEALTPTFAPAPNERGTPQWANVIDIHDYSAKPDAVGTLPRGLVDLDRILGCPDRDVWSAREGIVAACNLGTHLFWTLPTSQDVFQSWMEARGYSYETSPAGRIALQLIRRLGGLAGAGLIAHPEIVKKLNTMAHGNVELELPHSSEASPRKVRASVAPRSSWIALLKKASNQSRFKRFDLKSLTERDALRAGLLLHCHHCTQHTWFDVSEIRKTVRCDRCLESFSFPSDSPPKEWYYRTAGPFATENYAHGSYTVALGLRLLSDRNLRDITWVPSFALTRSDGTDLEADFALVCKDGLPWEAKPAAVFAECKSYNEFTAKDVTRMKHLGKAFPGSILGFCTLRNKLNKTEKKRLTRLAQLGRKFYDGDRWLNPVLVLTGIELFGTMGPPYCWQEAGGRYERLGREYDRHRGLQELAHTTQQMHLDMPSQWDVLSKNRPRVETVWKKGE